MTATEHTEPGPGGPPSCAPPAGSQTPAATEPTSTWNPATPATATTSLPFFHENRFGHRNHAEAVPAAVRGVRLGPHYDVLRAPGLDERRLALYRLVMHLRLVAGPLRLLDGAYPDPEPMRAIAEFNLRRALGLLRSAA
jgi:hypothetical protein